MANNQPPTINLNNTNYNIFLPRPANQPRKLNWRTIDRVIKYLNAQNLTQNQERQRKRYIRTNLLNPHNLAIRGNKVYDLDKKKAQTAFRNIRQKENLDKRFTKQRTRKQRALEKKQMEAVKKIQNAQKNRKTKARQIGGRTTRNIDGRLLNTYRFNIDGANIFNQVKEAIKFTIPRHRGHMIQIILSPHNANAGMDQHLSGNSLKTPYMNNMRNALRRLKQKYDEKSEEYEEEDDEMYDWDFRTIIIRYIFNPQIQGQGGTRTKSMADKIWFSLDKDAKYSCFWNCIYIINQFNKKQNENINQFKLRLENFIAPPNITIRNERITNGAFSLKRSARPRVNTFTDEDIIKNYINLQYGRSNTKKIYIIIYNNVYKEIRRYTPDNCDDINKLQKYEIQYINGHYIPLIRWNTIPINQNQLIEQINNEEVDEDEHQLIKKFKRFEPADVEHFNQWRRDIKQAENLTRFKKSDALNRYKRDGNLCVEHNDPKDWKVASWDIEATPNGNDEKFKAFCVSMAWVKNENDEIETKTFYGLNALEKFGNYLYDNIEQFNEYTFYAHNTGKFDQLLFFKEYLLTNKNKGLEIDGDKTITLNGAYIGVRLYKDDYGISFKDSLKILPASLDKLTNEFNVEHKKLGELGNYDNININNYNRADIEIQQRVYCKYDTIGLLEVLIKFRDAVFNFTGLNITDCYTGASLSKKHFFKNHYDSHKTPIYKFNRKLDDYIRKSYCGGRNEALFIGKKDHKVYYYDFTSLYPAEGRLQLPYGKPTIIPQNSIDYFNNTKDFKHIRYGFYRVKVKTKDFNAIPLHAEKTNRLLFSKYRDEKILTLFSEEIKYGHKLGIYDYELIDGYEFKKERFMKKFFNTGFENKNEAKKNDQEALAFVWKIIINSGYGFWGLNTMGKDKQGRDGVKIFKSNMNDFWSYLEQEKLVNIGRYGGYTIIRKLEELSVKDFSVAIASAITSYSRMKLYKLFKAVKDAGEEILYADTDSIITTLKLSEHPDIIRRFDWDRENDIRSNGEILGSLKNEADDEVKKVFKKKYKNQWEQHFNRQRELDGGEFHFDKLLGAGCKQYGLYKELYDGSKIEICKLKGFKKDKDNKLNFNKMEKLMEGFYKEKEIRQNNAHLSKNEMKIKLKDELKDLLIHQNQIQFLCPLTSHISEDDKMDITKKSVEKWFRVGYSKGNILDDGVVKPFIWENGKFN